MGNVGTSASLKSRPSQPATVRSASSSLSPGKAPVRKRRCTTKTRTGCLTCKARRVRCDEHKPQCWNCLKSRDRVCRGYGSPSPTQSMKSEHSSPPESTTASSSSAASASSSSHTSASTTPIGPHAPTTFSTDLTSVAWTPATCAEWEGQVPIGYFPLNAQLPPGAQQRSASLSTPIINYPVLPLRRHASTPGDTVDIARDATLSPATAQYVAWKSSAAAESSPATTGPPAKHSQHLSPGLNTENPHPRQSQSVPDNDSLSLAAYRPAPSPFTINPVISPLIADPITARTFDFYLRHSGSAMGARSSPSFFLSTIPQIASHCTHVRYALLAVALVDESVDDYATDSGKYGPGVKCVDQEARRASFEMYNHAIRALVEAKDDSSLLATTQSLDNLHQREFDNGLAAILITCLLLFSFEYWLWNYQNAARHLQGALGLMQRYERIMSGKQRRAGLLEEKVLPMMKQATRYHSMSLNQGAPASKFGQGATWDPSAGDAVLAV